MTDDLTSLRAKRDHLADCLALLSALDLADHDANRKADEEITRAITNAAPEQANDIWRVVTFHAISTGNASEALKTKQLNASKLMTDEWLRRLIARLDDQILNIDPEASPAIGKLAEAIGSLARFVEDPTLRRSAERVQMLEGLVRSAASHFPDGSPGRVYTAFKLIPGTVGLGAPGYEPKKGRYYKKHFEDRQAELVELREHAKKKALLTTAVHAEPNELMSTSRDTPSEEREARLSKLAELKLQLSTLSYRLGRATRPEDDGVAVVQKDIEAFRHEVFPRSHGLPVLAGVASPNDFLSIRQDLLRTLNLFQVQLDDDILILTGTPGTVKITEAIVILRELMDRRRKFDPEIGRRINTKVHKAAQYIPLDDDHRPELEEFELMAGVHHNTESVHPRYETVLKHIIDWREVLRKHALANPVLANDAKVGPTVVVAPHIENKLHFEQHNTTAASSAAAAPLAAQPTPSPSRMAKLGTWIGQNITATVVTVVGGVLTAIVIAKYPAWVAPDTPPNEPEKRVHTPTEPVPPPTVPEPRLNQENESGDNVGRDKNIYSIYPAPSLAPEPKAVPETPKSEPQPQTGPRDNPVQPSPELPPPRVQPPSSEQACAKLLNHKQAIAVGPGHFNWEFWSSDKHSKGLPVFRARTIDASPDEACAERIQSPGTDNVIGAFDQQGDYLQEATVLCATRPADAHEVMLWCPGHPKPELSQHMP